MAICLPMRRSRKEISFLHCGECLVSSSAFFRPFLTSSVSRGHVTRLKGSPYQGCVVLGEMSLLSGEREICELIRLRDDQRQQNMVPDLLKLKCAPFQAEKEKTAFTGDGDGWMSSIISGGGVRFLACWAWHSTGCALDILFLPRRCPPLDVPVMGASFLRPCRFRSGFTDQTYSNGDSHSWDHDECTV